MSNEAKGNIGVVGTGKVGTSLAVLFAGNGYKTTMLARTEKGYHSGLALFKTYYDDLVNDKLITREQADICARYLTVTREYKDLADADCIFEGIIEDVDAKREVYRQIAENCPKVKAVGSATSSIPPDTLIGGMALADRFLVAHPFIPPHMIPCFELVRGEKTTDETVDFVYRLLKDVGREPVLLMKSAPGFVVNRLQFAMYREAVYMVENGITTPEEIDKALNYSVAPRYTSIGLFEHMDNAGLDLDVNVMAIIYPALCNETKTPKIIQKHLDAGEYGLKSGRGMLDWSKKDITDFRKRCSLPYYKYFNWKLPKE